MYVDQLLDEEREKGSMGKGSFDRRPSLAGSVSLSFPDRCDRGKNRLQT
jgi:hypothetical protein